MSSTLLMSSLHLIQAEVPVQSAWKTWVAELYALLTLSQTTAEGQNKKKIVYNPMVLGWQTLPKVSVEHCNTRQMTCFPLRLAVHVLEVSD